MAKTIRKALRGHGDFVSDMYLKDMLYVATVRSPFARARILSMHTGSLPKAVICLTSKDIPGANRMEIGTEALPILAEDATRYVGEPVALLAGESQRDVVSAMSEMVVEYEERSHKTTFEHPTPEQIVATRLGRRGDAASALASASYVVEGSYATSIQEHLYNEPQGAVVVPEESTLVVHTATQWPFHVRDTVAVNASKRVVDCVVRVSEPGISLDGKLWYPSVVATHAALVAHATGRPAKLVYSNQEDYRFTPKRAPVNARHVTGLNSDGSLAAARVELTYSCGAYPLFTDEILDRLVYWAMARYRCPAVEVSATAVTTNLPPLNVFSGFGSASAFFALETHTSRVAEIAQTDSYTWKRDQLTSTPSGKNGGGAPQNREQVSVLDAVAIASDFSRKAAAFELQKKRRENFGSLVRQTHGIGIATAAQGSGFIGRHEEQYRGSISVRLNSEGTALLRTSAVPSNAAILRHWRNIVSGVLGLELSAVRVEEVNTSLVPDTGPSTLSRNLVVVSRIVEQACLAIQRKRFRTPLPIEATRSYRQNKSTGWDPATLSGTGFSAVSYAAATVEVIVDPVSFEPVVTGVWLAVNGGRVINESQTRRALEMGIYQALEWSSHEVVEYHQGAVDPRSYLSYRSYASPALPQIEVTFVDADNRNPMGVGELPQSCVPAAFASAVSQATGFYMDRVPTNPSAIHRYMGDE